MPAVLEVVDLKRYYSPLHYRMAKFCKLTALTKKLEYKVHYAVDGISFTVNSGEICGFLGPNGAGKSTTIKTILGLLRSGGGTVKIAGRTKKEAGAAIFDSVGGIIEAPDMYRSLSGRNNLKYFAMLRGIYSKELVDRLLETANLTKFADEAVGNYSLGMKQRLGIAQAVMHNPKLLLLDEPANGLDPQGVIDLRHMLKRLAHEQNIAVLVSSHQLSEMQQMCDRVIIMKNGKIIAEKKIEELDASDTCTDVIFSADKPEEAVKLLKEKYGLSAVSDKNKIFVRLEKAKVPEVTKELLLAGIMISGVSMKESTLEDLFVELTGGAK